MKKILSFGLIVFSFSIFAHDQNFYVAADAGIFQGDFDTSYSDQTDVIAQNFQQTVAQRGYTGGLALGYSKPMLPHYFLGGEISGNYESNNATFQEGASSGAFTDKTQFNGHMDFTFVPGINLSKTISAFMKLGLSLAWIQDNLTSPVGFTPTIANYSNNLTALGFAAGLGVSKAICKKFALFTEADYHDYGTRHFQSFQNFTANYSHAAHLYSYDVLAGAAYKF